MGPNLAAVYKLHRTHIKSSQWALCTTTTMSTQRSHPLRHQIHLTEAPSSHPQSPSKHQPSVCPNQPDQNIVEAITCHNLREPRTRGSSMLLRVHWCLRTVPAPMAKPHTQTVRPSIRTQRISSNGSSPCHRMDQSILGDDDQCWHPWFIEVSPIGVCFYWPACADSSMPRATLV